MSRRYIEHYLISEDVEERDIKNLEEAKFLQEYKNGLSAYDSEDFPAVIEHLEHSLWDFLKAEEDCRFYCEGSFDSGWFPDLTTSIASTKRCEMLRTHIVRRFDLIVILSDEKFSDVQFCVSFYGEQCCRS